MRCPRLSARTRRRDLGEVSPAASRKDCRLLVEEMDAAGVVWGVPPVRLPQEADNEDALRLMEEYPGHFLGIP